MSVEASRKHGPFDTRWRSGHRRRSEATSPADAAQGLDWEGFSGCYFPPRGRHDLEALSSYAAYRLSREEPESVGMSRPELHLVRKPPDPAAHDPESKIGEAQPLLVAAAAMHDWESEGGYTARPHER
jgi:hypothetical protein